MKEKEGKRGLYTKGSNQGLQATRERKIIQISAVPGAVFALCDDFTVWAWDTLVGWRQLPGVPTK